MGSFTANYFANFLTISCSERIILITEIVRACLPWPQSFAELLILMTAISICT